MDISIEELILNGMVEVSGVDEETGEFLYTFTEQVEKIMPEVYKRHMDSVHKDIMFFWEHGFLNISNMDEYSPNISLTPKAFDAESIKQLPKQKQKTLFMIKQSFGVF